jgi:hypothetical protein
MADRQITKKKKGFLVKYPGTKGQTFYGGTSGNKRFGDSRYADGLFKKAKALYKSITN